MLAKRPSGPAIGVSSSRCFRASHRAPTSAAVNWHVESCWHQAIQLLNASSNPTSWVLNCCSTVSPRIECGVEHHCPHPIGEHGRVHRTEICAGDPPRNEICSSSSADRMHPCRGRCSWWNRSVRCRRTWRRSRRCNRSWPRRPTPFLRGVGRVVDIEVLVAESSLTQRMPPERSTPRGSNPIRSSDRGRARCERRPPMATRSKPEAPGPPG